MVNLQHTLKNTFRYERAIKDMLKIYPLVDETSDLRTIIIISYRVNKLITVKNSIPFQW